MSALLAVVGLALAMAAPRTVVVLKSDRGPEVEETLRARLQALPGGVNLVTENLDLNSLEDAEYASRLAALLRRKYQDRTVDLVVPVQLPATRFMAQYGESTFPGTPVVFCVVDTERLAAIAVPPSMAGSTGRVALVPTVEAALRLQPGTKQIVLVAGEAPSDRYWRERAKRELRGLREGLEIVAPEGLAMPDLLDRLRKLPDHAIVLFLVLTVDGTGSSYSADAVRLVSGASRVPVYAFSESTLGSGVMGGKMFSPEREAEKAAGIAIRILSGERAQDIGVSSVEASAFVFDWRQLDRWGIPESRLPPGSLVRFRPPSPWALYGGWIFAGLALVLLQSVLIGALFVQRAARRRVEAELDERCRFEELLSDLTRRLTQADAAALDGEIGTAVRRLGEALAVDRVEVGQFHPGGRVVEITHLWQRADAPVLPLEPNRFDQLADRVHKGEVIGFAAGAGDSSPRASIIVPLSVGGAALGAIGLGIHRGERAWSREILNRLRFAGEILAGALMRRRFETILAERQGVSTPLFASLYGRVAVLDRHGEILAVNDAWIRAAHSAPEAAGRGAVGGNYLDSCRAAAARDDPAAIAVAQGLAAVLDGVAPSFSTEYRIASAGGDGWTELMVQPLQRPEGGAVVTLVDVTDRKRAEMEAGRLREDLAHLTRVSTLGELAASLAHELNQPLTAILSNVQAAQLLLDRESPDLGEIREILREVVSDDKRAGEVIQGLRALFRKGIRDKGRLDLNELVREVSRLLDNDVALGGVALRLELDAGLPPVDGDRVQLQQVILNLAVNGLDAVRDRPAGERHLAIRSSLAGRTARIEVADSGPGIAFADRTRLFDPFFTTKPGGMGMGLAIARSIMEAHGGSLSVTDDTGEGSTFFAVFPVAPGIEMLLGE
jgi:signal transduction histidine kinase/ABC-type uncharacterized transport system substrate-binding protein